MSLSLATKGIIGSSYGLSLPTKGVINLPYFAGLLFQSLISAASDSSNINLLIRRSFLSQSLGVSSSSDIDLIVSIVLKEFEAVLLSESYSSDVDLFVSRLLNRLILAESSLSLSELTGVAETFGLILNPFITSVTANRSIEHLPYEIKPYP